MACFITIRVLPVTDIDQEPSNREARMHVWVWLVTVVTNCC